MSQTTKNSIPIWQKHLDELHNEDSAPQFFINQIKKHHHRELLDPQHDFYVSPFDKEELLAATEGQLSLDVFQTENEIIVKAAIAGVQPEDVEIIVENDILTIRGERFNDETESYHDYLYQECYWGRFSRSIILPHDIDADNITAVIKNGILKITLPKVVRNVNKKISVHEIEN